MVPRQLTIGPRRPTRIHLNLQHEKNKGPEVDSNGFQQVRNQRSMRRNTFEQKEELRKNLLWDELKARDNACGETRATTTATLKEGPSPSGSNSGEENSARINNAMLADERQREPSGAGPCIRIPRDVAIGEKKNHPTLKEGQKKKNKKISFDPY